MTLIIHIFFYIQKKFIEQILAQTFWSQLIYFFSQIETSQVYQPTASQDMVRIFLSLFFLLRKGLLQLVVQAGLPHLVLV